MLTTIDRIAQIDRAADGVRLGSRHIDPDSYDESVRLVASAIADADVHEANWPRFASSLLANSLTRLFTHDVAAATVAYYRNQVLRHATSVSDGWYSNEYLQENLLRLRDECRRIGAGADLDRCLCGELVERCLITVFAVESGRI